MWHTFTLTSLVSAPAHTAWGPSVTRCRSKDVGRPSDGAGPRPISQHLLRKQRELNRGNIWKYLEISGNIWKYLEISGNIWKYLEISGNIWKYLEIAVCLSYVWYIWICLSMATFQDNRHWSLWKPHLPHRCQLELDAKGLSPCAFAPKDLRGSRCWFSEAKMLAFQSHSHCFHFQD